MGLTAADIIKAGGKLPAELLKETERRKYGNRKPVIDDIKFDSQREADEYCRLKIEKRAGLIQGFDRQVSFTLQAPFLFGKRQIRPVVLIVDFVITELDGSKTIREAKGVRTQAYSIKRKLFLKQYPKYKFVEV